jgi:hypothetical protein
MFEKIALPLRILIDSLMYLSPGDQLRIRRTVIGCAMRAAQELLGAPTIGGGSAWPGGRG